MTFGRVHQVVYRWAETTLTGGRGVGPVASSLTLDELHAWRPRLDGEIWAAPQRPGDPAGLSYLEADGDGVVVHKVSVPDMNNRPNSTLTHVLIGDAELLGPLRALGLTDWPDWFREESPTPPDGALPTLSLDDLVAAADEGIRPIRAQARALPAGPVEQLVTWVLGDLDGRFSVLTNDVPVHAVLCAVLDVLGPLGGRWTFAGRESADEGDGRPRLIFLSELPEAMATRPRLTLTGEPSGDVRRDQFVATFVDAYRRGGRPAVRRVWPQGPLTRPRDVAGWINDALVAPGVLRDPVGLLERAGAGTLSRAEAAYVETAGDQFGQVVNELPERHFLALLADWHPEHVGRTLPRLNDRVVDEAVNRSLSAATATPELIAATARLRPRLPLIERAVTRRLHTERKSPDQTRLRTTLLDTVAALGVPADPYGRLEQLLLGELAARDLVHHIAISRSPARAEVLLAALERLEPGRSDSGVLFPMLLERDLLYPVLEKHTARAQLTDRLRHLLLRLFGDGIGLDSQIGQMLAHFGDSIPAPVLGALRMVAATPGALQMVDDVAVRHFYRDAGQELPPARVGRVPQAPAGPDAGPGPAPPVPAKSGRPRLLRRLGGPWRPVLLSAAVAAFTLVAVAFFVFTAH